MSTTTEEMKKIGLKPPEEPRLSKEYIQTQLEKAFVPSGRKETDRMMYECGRCMMIFANHTAHECSCGIYCVLAVIVLIGAKSDIREIVPHAHMVTTNIMLDAKIV